MEPISKNRIIICLSSFINFGPYAEIWTYFHSEEKSKNHLLLFWHQKSKYSHTSAYGKKLRKLKILYFFKLLTFKNIKCLYFFIFGSLAEIWLYFLRAQQKNLDFLLKFGAFLTPCLVQKVILRFILSLHHPQPIVSQETIPAIHSF